MRPIDHFRYLKNNQISPDASSLLQLYQPLMGSEAHAVYSYLVHFFDHGRAVHRFSDLLNHLQLGFGKLQESLDVLGALGLISLYQQDQSYVIQLHSPLDRVAFLANPVYYNLLKARIGQVALDDLAISLPTGLVNVTKPFSAVFSDRGEVYHQPQKAKVDFDLEHFKQLMARDGLAFADESSDVLALYRLAETQGLTWFDTYQLAKATAVAHTISIERLKAHQESSKEPQAQGDFTPQELAAIKAAKNHQPEAFLALLKKEKKAVVIDQERQLLRELGQQGFLDQVINIMVLRTLQRTKSANLNKVYVMKLANDLASKDIKTAEAAVTHFKTPVAKSAAGQSTAPAKTNVPVWSQQDYKTQASEAELAELDRLRREMLGQGREEN